jgi:signal transduction histidine kinase
VPRGDALALQRALRRAAKEGSELRWVGRVAVGPAETHWVELSASGRSVSTGRAVWDGIVTDITPRKRAEAALTASREELRTLATHQTRVREQEREAIAREIHDDVGSTLTAIKFELAFLRTALKEDARFTAPFARVGQLIDTAILSSTRIMHDLRPGILDEGVVAALEWQARSFEQRMGIACRFASSHEEIPLSPEQAIAVFRICQEALNNVAKYANARAVDIKLRAGAGRLTLDIGDDGRGIDEADLHRPDRFGLRGMRERAHSLGGSVEIRGVAGRGTSIAVVLPLARPLADAPADVPTRASYAR